MVNFARCKVLGANVLKGPDQLPWQGKLQYDYQLWIDSDIVFNLEAFYKLIWMDKDIAAGGVVVMPAFEPSALCSTHRSTPPSLD